MQYPDPHAYAQALTDAKAKGPIALIVAEDDVEVASTLLHHAECGFRRIALFLPVGLQLSALPDVSHDVVRYDLSRANAVPDIVNAVIAACPQQWIYLGYNAEYLFYPFSVSRRVGEMLVFATEERRPVVMSTVLDLYAPDLVATPNGVDLARAHFDSVGYFDEPVLDAAGNVLPQQLAVQGGLRWRFEEHVPQQSRRLDRPCLFRAVPDLRMQADRRFNIAEYNTYNCPWHHNVTACVASFRAAKALRRNPVSHAAIHNFWCAQSTPFHWSDQQLMDLGFMEPGQWF